METKEKNQLRDTGEAVLAAIENDDEKAFRALIAPPLPEINEDEKSVSRKFRLIREYYRNYTKGERPDLMVTDSTDKAGRRIVFVPIYSRTVNTENLKEVKLMLGFGPDKKYPADKISSFGLLLKYESNNNLPLPDEMLPGI